MFAGHDIPWDAYDSLYTVSIHHAMPSLIHSDSFMNLLLYRLTPLPGYLQYSDLYLLPVTVRIFRFYEKCDCWCIQVC